MIEQLGSKLDFVVVSFSGTKKKKRSKKKDQEVPNEVEVKQNDVEVHEEKRCDEPDEKPSTGKIL